MIITDPSQPKEVARLYGRSRSYQTHLRGWLFPLTVTGWSGIGIVVVDLLDALWLSPVVILATLTLAWLVRRAALRKAKRLKQMALDKDLIVEVEGGPALELFQHLSVALNTAYMTAELAAYRQVGGLARDADQFSKEEARAFRAAATALVRQRLLEAYDDGLKLTKASG